MPQRIVCAADARSAGDS